MSLHYSSLDFMPEFHTLGAEHFTSGDPITCEDGSIWIRVDVFDTHVFARLVKPIDAYDWSDSDDYPSFTIVRLGVHAITVPGCVTPVLQFEALPFYEELIL